jgi:hypothetical protein
MQKKFLTSIIFTGLVLIAGMNSGCSKDSPSSAITTTPTVNMSVSFSQSSAAGLHKGYSTLAVDQVRIDSAVIIFSNIKFESHFDSSMVLVDGSTMADSGNIDVWFKGPFVVHVRDTIGINFASAQLPAGTYSAVKFRIHNLIRGEFREDSDERMHRPFILGDSALAGSSVTVWGVVVKNGVSTNFAYHFNGEVEFVVRGNFVVPAAGSAVSVAMNFNISSFFIDPKTGALLDPTDTSMMNREVIRRAIYTAFGKGKWGHDRGDGHPDND